MKQVWFSIKNKSITLVSSCGTFVLQCKGKNTRGESRCSFISKTLIVQLFSFPSYRVTFTDIPFSRIVPVVNIVWKYRRNFLFYLRSFLLDPSALLDTKSHVDYHFCFECLTLINIYENFNVAATSFSKIFSQIGGHTSNWSRNQPDQFNSKWSTVAIISDSVTISSSSSNATLCWMFEFTKASVSNSQKVLFISLTLQISSSSILEKILDIQNYSD